MPTIIGLEVSQFFVKTTKMGNLTAKRSNILPLKSKHASHLPNRVFPDIDCHFLRLRFLWW